MLKVEDGEGRVTIPLRRAGDKLLLTLLDGLYMLVDTIAD